MPSIRLVVDRLIMRGRFQSASDSRPTSDNIISQTAACLWDYEFKRSVMLSTKNHLILCGEAGDGPIFPALDRLLR